MVIISELWNSLTFRKRLTEGIVFLVATGLIAYLIRVESYLKEATAGATLTNRFLIFGITNIVILLIILLVYLVCRTVARILMARRRGSGTGLKSKLIIAFVGLSFVPTILLFIVSTGYINTSIVTWFNSQILQSISRSMEVVKETYRTGGENALHFGRRIGATLDDGSLFRPEGRHRLEERVVRLQQEYLLSRVQIISQQGQLLAEAYESGLDLSDFPSPTAAETQEVLGGRELVREASAEGSDLLRGMVPVWVNGAIAGVVVVDYFVPESLAGKVHEIARSYQAFRQASSLKNPIRNEFFLTLLLISLVIMFLSVWLGTYLANSLTTPIQNLADATKRVAEGDLEIHLDGGGDDEIGQLVVSFDRMTAELRANRQALNQAHDRLMQSNRELEQRRHYMEIVLENVVAGVVSFSRDGVVTTINQSAQDLLNLSAGVVTGRHFSEIVNLENLEVVTGLFAELEKRPYETLRRQLTLPVSRNKGRMTLQISMAVLKNEQGEAVGTVAVFDDLTQIMRAQRMAAWREVARRIAHEIKNPLTPIRLSAQRLRRRYLSRFTDDNDVFDTCTQTIIRSVDEMKSLVDEFSTFARLPAAQPAMNDLNEIVEEALDLYREAHRGTSFTFRPDPALPRFQLDRDQIKRVLINLFDNAVAALGGKGKVEIVTRYHDELKFVSCEVADNGPGIAPDDRSRLFEPYFSTKATGTGLGLAIVNTIISDHHGFIRVVDNEPKGTRFVIELPVE